jgi:outer membrane immunogenic protein
MSTRSINLSSGSFLGGVQAGYNYQRGAIVTGIESDIQWLGNSDDSKSVSAFTALNGFPESYSGTVTASRSLDYIGTLRARLGLLVNPDTLVYLTGGMAYGDASLKYSVRAQESLGPGDYIPLIASNSASSTLVGGTIGAGSEVRVTSNMSIKGEYLFYDLGSLTARGPWTQNCVPGVCADPAAGAWGAATVHSKATFEGQLIRVGLNFKFGDDRGVVPLK